jgi:adenosylcobinamide-phosphate synthase
MVTAQSVARRAAAAAAGLVADRVLGEPPGAVHPVAAFGALMHGVEQRVYGDAVAPGAA